MEFKKRRTYTVFNVIEVVDEGGSYPTLLGIGWDNDNLVVINLKKRVMNFENHDIRIIAPREGRRYVEPVKEEVVGGWDHVYNISEDYVHPNADRDLGWRSSRSASSNSSDAMENWQNLMHEVLIWKCGLITQSL